MPRTAKMGFNSQSCARQMNCVMHLPIAHEGREHKQYDIKTITTQALDKGRSGLRSSFDSRSEGNSTLSPGLIGQTILKF